MEFDFRFHAGCDALVGTQYFELVPGAYAGHHWAPEGRFIDEYTFSLFEGVFEKHVPEYDHFAFFDVPRVQWAPVLADLGNLARSLETAGDHGIVLPFGSTLNVREAYEEEIVSNQRHLAVLLNQMCSWINETLTDHEYISVLGL